MTAGLRQPPHRMMWLGLVVAILSAAFGAGYLSIAPSTSAGPVLESVIVQLRPGEADVSYVAGALLTPLHGKLGAVWSAGIRGFAARVPSESVAALRHAPQVRRVELDGVVRIEKASSASGGLSWGLDRLDQRALPLDQSYKPPATGNGVTAYVIDTGIRTSHADFGGRASTGIDLVDGGAADDCNGHGTHVAGTIGGRALGVASNVSLVAVRVLDCDGAGSTSRVISGIEWVTSHHAAGAPEVANLSLGGASSAVLDSAVRASIKKGVVYTVAAGNGTDSGKARSACDISPARVREAITVSATDASDTRAPWAGFGACVDLFAPGVGITSAWDTSDTATKTISGTSMASPHVAGAVALYLELHPGSQPSEVAAGLESMATSGAVQSAKTTRPLLLCLI